MGLGRRPVLIAKWWGDYVSELPHQRAAIESKSIIEIRIRLPAPKNVAANRLDRGKDHVSRRSWRSL